MYCWPDLSAGGLLGDLSPAFGPLLYRMGPVNLTHVLAEDLTVLLLSYKNDLTTG